MKGYYIEPNRFELQRFFGKVEVTKRGCWRWRGARTESCRAVFSARHGAESAARTAFRWFIGSLSDGIQVDHLCYRRDCVNPAHLEAVTAVENTRRAQRRHTHCRNGHERASNIRRHGNSRSCHSCYLASRKRSKAKLAAIVAEVKR